MALAQAGGKTYLNAALVETKVSVLVGSFSIFNVTAYNSDDTDTVYVQFYDALTANVTVGTTTPTWIAPLPPTGGLDGGLTCPKAFHTGVVIAATSSATGAGAPAASALVSFDYVSA